MLDFKVVIPARHASTRLPGKALELIAGKPMIVRVAERVRSSGATEVWVATDHAAIFDAVTSAGFNGIMTSATHLSGTDRIAEVVEKQGWRDDEIVLNVQGDEPLIAPELIRQVARQLHKNAHASIATACHWTSDRAKLNDLNVVKVVFDQAGNAMYFSRACIPYIRDGAAVAPNPGAYKHIGIYAYRAGFLKVFGQLEAPLIERLESLEQLRALWHGYKISVTISDLPPGIGVDTQQDLENVRAHFTQQN